MANNNNNSSDNDQEDLEKRAKEARDKFDQNYMEFKRKKLAETPCFRSTFLTSKFDVIEATYRQQNRV